MIKGYTKDIYNPHVEVLAATATEGRELELAGYTAVTEQEMKQDPADPTGEPRHLYKVTGRGLSPTITGFFSNTGRALRGWAVHNGAIQVGSEQYNRKNAAINARVKLDKDKAIAKANSNGSNYDPRISSAINHMVPVLGNDGQAKNYRYLMTNDTKDSVLERDNRADMVIGAMTGSMFDKINTPKLNKQGVDAVKADYDERRLTDPDAFIVFGPDSTDPVIRERYQLLPDDTKLYIKEVWGHNEMLISNDAYNLAFGYRKYSLGDMFDKNPDHRNYLEQMLVLSLEAIVGKKAALRVVQAENVWQEVVKVVKDILVIKNLFTFLGNESSNLTLLLMAGVPIKDIVRSKVVAYPATLSFQKDRREREALQRTIDVGYVVGKEKAAAESRIIELDDAMARNPMKELIDAGMFQTLVEDIGVEEDPYSYKSKLTRLVDSKTGADSKDRTVQGLRTIGKNLLMTHDTPLYKVMNQATILSDFTSRYALHQHQTTRKNKPLSNAESLRRARAYFVNYDVPTHKALQYLNDTGLLWFTKYYLRIQAVIFTIVRENPLGALSILGLNDYFGNFSDILDSSMVQSSPVKTGAGALEIFGAVDEIITLNTLGL